MVQGWYLGNTSTFRPSLILGWNINKFLKIAIPVTVLAGIPKIWYPYRSGRYMFLSCLLNSCFTINPAIDTGTRSLETGCFIHHLHGVCNPFALWTDKSGGLDEGGEIGDADFDSNLNQWAIHFNSNLARTIKPGELLWTPPWTGALERPFWVPGFWTKSSFTVAKLSSISSSFDFHYVIISAVATLTMSHFTRVWLCPLASSLYILCILYISCVLHLAMVEPIVLERKA